MVDFNLNSVLTSILLPQHHGSLSEWLTSASVSEKKGVKMLGAIQKHKGSKKFRAPAIASQDPIHLAAEMHRRTLKSTYETEFAVPSQQRPLTAVLSRTKFGDLPCSQILTPVAVRFVEAWLGLGDEGVYVETVLETLRSLLAFLTSTRRPTSESRRSFMWNDPSKVLKPHRLDQLTNRSLQSRNASTGRPWAAPKAIEKHDTSMQANTFTAEDLRKRRDKLTKGSGHVATWIVGPQEVGSLYQQTYVTHFNKYQGVATREKAASLAAGRMVPNPDIENNP